MLWKILRAIIISTVFTIIFLAEKVELGILLNIWITLFGVYCLGNLDEMTIKKDKENL